MAQQVHALTVILEKDLDLEDVQPLIAAIAEMRNVAKVDQHITDMPNVVALEQARFELRDKIWKVMYPKNRKNR